MLFKKCFPTAILLNSHCQTIPRPSHEKGRSSAGKKSMSVVCFPCLGRQVKYQTNEEAWHTRSFLLGFRHTKGQCQDVQLALILNSVIFQTQARVISSKGHRSQDACAFLEAETIRLILRAFLVGVVHVQEVLQEKSPRICLFLW